MTGSVCFDDTRGSLKTRVSSVGRCTNVGQRDESPRSRGETAHEK